MNEGFRVYAPETQECIEAKFCPLLTSVDPLRIHCSPGCAWFDEDRHQCVMMTIAKAEAKRK